MELWATLPNQRQARARSLRMRAMAFSACFGALSRASFSTRAMKHAIPPPLAQAYAVGAVA